MGKLKVNPSNWTKKDLDLLRADRYSPKFAHDARVKAYQELYEIIDMYIEGGNLNTTDVVLAILKLITDKVVLK